jgi:uncharacterized protein YndB with AHSA1/START domain
MSSIHKEITVDAPPEQVWAAVSDVGAVHRRLTPGLVLDTHLAGDVRTLRFPGGAVARELIVAIDNERRRLAYSVVEGRMPLVHHHASFQVFADGVGGTRLVWITDVLPHSLDEEVRVRVERGASVMKQALEAEARVQRG